MDQYNLSIGVHARLAGKTAFVTGGSGFIGGRLVESLVLDHGVKVRALVRTAASGAMRMARLGTVDFVHGDITDSVAMAKAMDGCDYVFHLAFGKYGSEKEQQRLTINGTRCLGDAAVKAGVDRFINVSTAAVYPDLVDGVIDESASRRPSGWYYADSKLAAEDVLRDLHSSAGLKTCILQVANVYGPWSPVFTVSPIKQLLSNRVVLVDNGDGVSNATFVDDVVQALLLAATNDSAIGETFLIKGPGRVTRRQFMEAYQSMLGTNSLVGMTVAEVRSYARKEMFASIRRLPRLSMQALKQSSEFKAAAVQSPIGPIRNWLRTKLPEKSKIRAATSRPPLVSIDERPLLLPPKWIIPRLIAKTEFSSEKATKLLGYDPQYDLIHGMTITEQWARWARLIPITPTQSTSR